MCSASFKNVIYELFIYKSYIYIGFGFKLPTRLICHKNSANQLTIFFKLLL